MEKKLFDFGNKLKEILKDDLLCFAVYGSYASGEIYKTSDFNTIIILKKLNKEVLTKIAKPIKNWCGNKNPLPVIFTLETLKRSTDVFPLEFLEIKKYHKIIAGEDLISKINVNIKNLRLEIERELKSIHLNLIRAFINTEIKAKDIKMILAKSVSSTIALMKGILILMKIKYDNLKKTDIIEKVSDKLKLNKLLFFDILNLKNDLNSIPDNKINDFYFEYLEQLNKLIEYSDKYKGGKK